MNETDFLNDFNGNLAELSKLVRSWNLIPGSFAHEADKVSRKILKSLYEDRAEAKIKGIIESELCVRYGLFISEFNSEKLVNEVMGWWNNK
jgi:hypothetical protein